MRKILLGLVLSLLVSLPLAADSDTTTLSIHVTSPTGKPVDRASVIVKFVQGRHKIKMTKIRKSWELRTSQEGFAKIPPIPKGDILIQVHAQGFQTHGQTYTIEEDEKTVEIELKPPQKQYSVHEKQ